MSRPNWSGFLRFNLLSIPVKGYNAANSSSNKTGFHLLHKTCHNRINYKKVCPIHGEVRNDEIISGYEVSKGNYVTVDAEEKAELKTEDEKTIEVDAFVHADALDPIYLDGRSYFLVPDGKVAQKPYCVLLEAMRDEKRYGIAQVVFSGRLQTAAVRPSGGVLTLSILHYENEVKKSTDFEDEVDGKSVTAEERKLAETLIEAATVENLDLSQYKDEYNVKLAKLVEGKSRTKKTTSGAKQEEPAIINLMDALRQSLARTQKSKGKKAPAAAKAAPAPHRRKSG